MNILECIKSLKNHGITTSDQLLLIRREAEKRERPLHVILLDLNLLTEESLFSFFEEQTKIPFKIITNAQVDAALRLLEGVHFSFWEKVEALPFLNHDKICVAMMDPFNITNQDFIIQTLSPFTNFLEESWRYFVSPRFLVFYFQKTREEDTPWFEKLLKVALDLNVSDIHFEPNLKDVGVRLRIDGLLTTFGTISCNNWDNLINQLKVESRLDISEKRRPQSAHLNHCSPLTELDLRLSTHPTIYGESAVIRVLNKNKHLRNLEELGFHPKQLEILKEAIHSSEGLILLCGPTGSGKTTTLYSMLSLLDVSQKNVMTLENPVEYHLEGVRQSDITEGILSFEDGIRSVLRHDVDILLVGEIRDEHAAATTFRSALTGHLVLSTIHAKDCFSVFHRLLDFKIPLNLILSTIRIIVSQRLVRKLCQTCQGMGCNHCFDQGFLGRTVIGEILIMDSYLEQALLQNTAHFFLEEVCQKKGFFSMKDHAYYKIEQGETTLAEIQRVVTL